MKKRFALLLALAVCLGLCACGNGKTPPAGTPQATLPTAPLTNGSEKLKEPVTVETLAGTYKARLWFLDHTVTVNADNTYSFSTGETGTYSLDDKYITLTSEDGAAVRNFMAGKACIYTFESWYFDADRETSITLSVGENGFTDQSFEATVPDGGIPGCDHDRILLELNADGTFVLTLSGGASDAAEAYEGTYVSRNATLLLTYNGQDYPLIMNNANYVYFLVYDKV